MRSLSRYAMLVLVFLTLTSEARASLIRYDFTAEDSDVGYNGDVSSWSSVFVGGDVDRTITGYFVVDTDLAFASTQGSVLGGFGSIIAFGLSSPMLANGRGFTSADEHQLQLNSANTVNGTFDYLSLYARLEGPQYSSYAWLYLFDQQGTGLDSFYPTGTIDVAQFNSPSFAIVDRNQAGDFRFVGANVTSLTGKAVPVPEAGSTLLLLVGGLMAWRRRRAS